MHQADLDGGALAHFEFTEAWAEMGILTSAVLDDLWARWAEGNDRNLEHYRWSAFRWFLQANTTLTTAQFDRLWELGCADTDQTMGCSMLFELIQRRDCPKALLEQAALSQHTALIRKSHQLLSIRFPNTAAG